MGTWNYRILCDDTALDAMCELSESRNAVKDIKRFLDQVIEEDGYLDVTVCQYGLVAAAAVDISMNGVDWQILSDCRHDPQDEEDSYIRFTDDMRKRRLKKFRAKAIKALQRIKGDDSELRDLWEENEELYPKWIGNIDRIIKRLGK